MSKRVFVINPGSTSTKIAVYDGEEALFQETIRHSAEELSVFPQISDQEGPLNTHLVVTGSICHIARIPGNIKGIVDRLSIISAGRRNGCAFHIFSRYAKLTRINHLSF